MLMREDGDVDDETKGQVLDGVYARDEWMDCYDDDSIND